jgi:hypothetical protein
MPVNTPHKSYKANIKKWTRARDCFEGSDAVKDRGADYLPLLDTHNTGDDQGYEAYKTRALFYNATGRTVEGLAGFIFQKDPEWDIPKKFEDHLKDVTMDGVDATTFALRLAREILLTGRVGLLLDMQKEGGEESPRPYWIIYDAEDIISWRVERREGDPAVVTRIVLRETDEDPDPNDEFEFEEVEQYRVLELNKQGVYQQTVWRKESKSADKWSRHGDVVIPERRGEPLSFIPFVFGSPTSLEATIEKGPLYDMIEVNLSHYRTMADLEHGRHFTALPTPWFSGARPSDETLTLGSGVAWELDQGGSAGMLEFTGAGLSALVTAEQDKRKMMAVLGARMLEEQPSTQETATAFMGRHTGEGASLRTIGGVIERMLNRVLRWHVWWLSTEAKPEDVKASVELNREFFMLRLNPQEVQAQLGLLQAEAISYMTFYHNLSAGGWTRADTNAEEEREQIQKEGGGTRPDEVDNELGGKVRDEDMGLEVKAGEEEAAGPGMQAGDVVVKDEGPWKIIKRGGKFWVIRADTGKVMHKKGYASKAKAEIYLKALRTHTKD